MKIWISKGSEVPVREQLTTQIMLALASGELSAGQRLPSTRELARRFDIHSNTVNAAYRDLANKGWLEFRKGSGVYVRTLDYEVPLDVRLELDQLISAFLQVARSKGFSLGEIRKRVRDWMMFQPPDHFLVIEPDIHLRDILVAEIEGAAKFRCRGTGYEECARSEVLTGAVPVAIYGRADVIRGLLPQGTTCLFLRSRSVQDEIQNLKALPPTTGIAVISCWTDFVKWAHATLMAAGINPGRLSFRDACEPGWQKGLTPGTFVITDVVQRPQIPPRCPCMEFHLLAQTSLEELQSCVRRFLSESNLV